MKPAIAVILAASLAAAIATGAQTKLWMWSPALLFVSGGLLLSVASRNQEPEGNILLRAIGFITFLWFALRAALSPVAEHALEDALLLSGCAAAFMLTRDISKDRRASSVFFWLLASIVLANVAAMIWQLPDVSRSPILNSHPSAFPPGFFGHYNDCANFLAGSGLLLLGYSLLGTGHNLTSRIIWFISSIAGIGAIYWTNSRGGMLAAVSGLLVLCLIIIAVGKVRKASWFVPLVLGLPVIVIGAFILLFKIWTAAQAARGYSLDTVLDNSTRLYFLDVALSCIFLHPLEGGGSRSFSWECYPFWNNKDYGLSAGRPEFVHNEFFQSLTDYGLIGGTLLIAFIVLLAINGLISIYRPHLSHEKSINSAGWVAGGIAGGVAVCVQGSFSFVFHMIPGVILLGICLGASSSGTDSPGSPLIRLHPIVRKTAKVVFTASILVAVIPSLRVLFLLKDNYFSRSTPRLLTTAGSLEQAVNILPIPSLRLTLAQTLQRISGQEEDREEGILIRKHADRLYDLTKQANPYDPSAALNHAKLLSSIGDNEKSEQEFERAITLQGGMENLFRVRFQYASHLLFKGRKSLFEGEDEKAATALLAAQEQIEQVERSNPWDANQLEAIHIEMSILEYLGLTREIQGNYSEAINIWDQASKNPNGTKSLYRSGVLIERIATSAWQERRPSEALSGFIEAKRRIGQSNLLPEGVMEQDKTQLLTYLSETIEYLQKAGIRPDESVPGIRD